MNGLFCLDNHEIPETDLAAGVYTTDLAMERYALRDNKSTIAMVHFHLFTQAAISETFRIFLVG